MVLTKASAGLACSCVCCFHVPVCESEAAAKLGSKSPVVVLPTWGAQPLAAEQSEKRRQGYSCVRSEAFRSIGVTPCFE